MDYTPEWDEPDSDGGDPIVYEPVEEEEEVHQEEEDQAEEESGDEDSASQASNDQAHQQGNTGWRRYHDDYEFLSFNRALIICGPDDFQEISGMAKEVANRIIPQLAGHLRLRRVDAGYTTEDVVWLVILWLHGGHRYRGMQAHFGISFRTFSKIVASQPAQSSLQSASSNLQERAPAESLWESRPPPA